MTVSKKVHYLLVIIILITVYFKPSPAQQYPKVHADMAVYQDEMNSLSKAHINTKTEWDYSINTGKVTPERYKSKVTKYDKMGRIMEIINISPVGEELSIILFKYDSRNLPLQETEFLLTGEYIGKTKYTYNPKGRLTDITCINESEFVLNRKVYDYNDTLNLITEWQYYSPDSVLSKTEYYYSNLENGVLQKQILYIGENKFDKSITYIRDSLQIVQKEEIRDSKKKIICFYEYSYNRNQQLQQIMANYLSDKKTPVVMYDYSPDGFLTSEVKYNRHGDVIEFKKYTYE